MTDKRQSDCKQFTILSRIDKERREVYNKKRHKIKTKTASFMMCFLQKIIFDISYNQHNPSKYHELHLHNISQTKGAPHFQSSYTNPCYFHKTRNRQEMFVAWPLLLLLLSFVV